MTKYYEAPCEAPNDGTPAVFLAGGITNCPAWHRGAADRILDFCPSALVFNPARENFPIGDPDAGWEQVQWEQRHLHRDNTLTLFWFPACDPSLTTQPIALFELGQALGERRYAPRPIVVGADPGYPRAADVKMMCQIWEPNLRVQDTLIGTVGEALLWFGVEAGEHDGGAS